MIDVAHVIGDQPVTGPGAVALERMGEPQLPDPDVASLTTRMASGEEAAFREFYERYFDRLLRYLLVVTGGREDNAREALQATFLRVARHAKRFPSEEVFWSWLTVLARSSVVDEHRKQTRYLGLLDRFFHRGGSDTAAAPENADSRLLGLLDQNLAGLSAQERDLIERKYFDRHSVAQIATALSLSEKAVESRLVRIRRRLKTLILKELNP